MADKSPIQTARDLAEAVQGLAGEVAALHLKIRRSVQRDIVLGASILLDIVLTVIALVAISTASNAAHSAGAAVARAAHADVSSAALCQAGNVSRHQQRDIWTFFLHLLGKPETAYGKHAERLLVMRLNTDFAPRDCARLGGGK